MSVTIVIELQARQGKTEALVESLAGARTFCLTVDGCEEFDVLRDKDDPSRFMLVEKWNSEDKHEKHFVENVLGSGMLEAMDALATQTSRSLWSSALDVD